MTDPRSRPQYGEYATPEEQAKAIGDSASAAPASAVPASTAPVSPQPPAMSASASVPMPKGKLPEGEAPEGRVPEGTVEDPVRRLRRSRDIVFTVTLLGIGLVWVLLSIPGASNLAETLDRTYAIQGYTGHYGPVALASTLGLIMNISSIVLWGITCVISIAVIRRRHRAFYIPIVGAAVAGVVVLVLTLVAMLSDPGLVAYVNSLQS